jgi:acylphosphatase
VDYGFILRENRRAGCFGRRLGDCETSVSMIAASRCRVCVLYSGHVQGVGFRYTAKSVARGFEVTGTVRNLPDGRVELIAEGARDELEAFQREIRDAGLEHFIRHEDVTWGEARGGFRGFEIVS